MTDLENKSPSSASSDSGLGGIDRRAEEDEFQLPNNWPDYDFHRKKSCLLSRIFSTCVTKAINHLELVQDAIEHRNTRTKRSATRREVSFSGAVPPSGQGLEIVGQGGQISGDLQSSHHDILEEEVLEEVLVLLARLDRERLRLINACEHEQEIRERLRDNIDQWRLKRLKDLPLAVQKEHDACVTDITELQWHIAYNARLAEKMLGKIDLARTWHRQLEIEVNDIRQTIPLITEKVQTEVVEIKKIDEALKETEHELMLSRAKNSDTLEKSTRANQRAGTEREEIRGEIEKAAKTVQKITSKLEGAIDQHKTYEKTIREAKETVKKNDRAYNSEVKKRDANRAEGTTLKLKLMTLHNERERIQNEIEHLKTELEQARLEEEERQNQRKKELESIQATVTKREEKLDKIIKKQREKNTLIDEDERRLEKILLQIDRDKKTLVRYDQQRTRDTDMLRTVTENLQRAIYTNDSISTDMQRETEKLKKEEDGMRNAMESLRRQIHDESTMIVLLDKHIDNDQRELAALNDAEATRAEHAERTETDLQHRCDTLTTTVTNLEDHQTKNQATLGSLRHQLLETNENYVKDKDRLTDAHSQISQQHQSASSTASDLNARVTYMTDQTVYMHKHIQEMNESRAMMETLTIKIRGEIQQAETELADVTYNLQLTEEGEQEVLKVLQQCLHRQKQTDHLNRQLYEERANYLQEKTVAIDKALLLNKQLASEYRDTLYTYYEIKSRLMGKLEHRLDAVARVKDTRQLIELQKRLHHALNFYFGVKNQYVEQRLAQLNQSSHQNGLHLSQVQESIQSAVDHISHFLLDQVDFEAIHREAMMKVHREELSEQQQKKSVPV